MECLRDNKRDDHRNKHSICPLLPPNGDFLLICQVILAAIRRIRIVLLTLRIFQYHALECEARIFVLLKAYTCPIRSEIKVYENPMITKGIRN